MENSSDSWDTYSKNLSLFLKQSKITTQFIKDAIDDTLVKDGIKEPIEILDVGAGTGDGTIELLEAALQVNPNNSAIAIDFSPVMIEFINGSIAKEKIKNLTTIVMDGMDLKFPENKFQYVYSIFGLIFFPDRVKGMKEIHRVLKFGGKVAITSWGENAIFTQILKKFIQNIGKHCVGSDLKEENYFSFASLRDPVKFESELKEAGFHSISIKTIQKPIKEDVSVFKMMLRNNPMVVQIMKDTPEMSIPLSGDGVGCPQHQLPKDDYLLSVLDSSIEEIFAPKTQLVYESVIGVGTK
eukprot:gene8485-10429_t